MCGVEGWSSRQARPQQLHLTPHCTLSRTALTWAEIARGGNSTHQEAPTTSPADAITLYKRYVTMGFQARFSIKSNAGYEDITLFCCLPVSSVASNKPSQPPRSCRCQRQRNHPRNRDKPATCTTSAQTEPLASMSPSRLLCTASPPPLGQTSSPTAPPPAKKNEEVPLRVRTS